MTAMVAAPPVFARPVPWSRLGWVVWRRYRATLLATIGVLSVLAVYLVIDGEQLRSSYHSFTSCRPVDTAGCQYKFQLFRESGFGIAKLLNVVLMFLPGVVGAFAGAPILARELETGTFRFAWTQGVGRMRWATAVLVCGALGVAVLMAAFGALITWHNQPLVDSGVTPRLQTTAFPETGIAAAGWALLGFAIGVLAGLIWRRVVPAIVTALAVWFVLADLASTYRMNYVQPLTSTDQLQPLKAEAIHQWWTRGGVRVSNDQVSAALSAVGVQLNSNGGTVTPTAPGSATANTVDPVQYLVQHGYTQVTSYQPDGRYWPLQWIEFGWLAALALVLLGTALWLLHRRPA